MKRETLNAHLFNFEDLESQAEEYLASVKKKAVDILEQAVKKVFDFRPASIIEDLKLRKVKYKPLAAYGHMGRTDLDIPWEKTDKAAQLKEAVNSVI